MCPSHCISLHLTGWLFASLAAHTSGARCAHRIASHCISPVGCSHLLQYRPVVRDVPIALHLIASHRLAVRISCSTHQWCAMCPSHCITLHPPVGCSHLLQHTPVVRDVPIALHLIASHRLTAASHCISPVGCSHLLQHTPVVRDVPIALHLIASHRLTARISCSTDQWCAMCPSHCISLHLTGWLFASLAAHTSGARCAYRIASHCISLVGCSHLLQHTPVVRDVPTASSHHAADRIAGAYPNIRCRDRISAARRGITYRLISHSSASATYAVRH